MLLPSSFYSRAAPVVLLLCTLLLYATCLQNGFLHWDDNVYVTHNEHLAPLNLATLKWILTTTHSGNWHPLAFLSHAIDVQLFGLNAKYHHLVNVLIHSANVLLVFFLSGSLFRLASNQAASSDAPILLLSAFIAALLFAIHPLRVESVAWVAERKDLLYAFFFLSSLIAYLKYATDAAQQRQYYGYALLLFFFSLTAKPMAVTLPLVLLILDFTLLQNVNDRNIGRILYEKLPFILLSLIIAIITVAAQADFGAVKDSTAFPLDNRIYNAFNSLIHYLQKTLLPLVLLPHYIHPEHVQQLSPRTLLNISIVVSTTILALHYALRRTNPIAASWLYYVVTLLPVLGLIQAGDQAAADRFTYLPTLPLYLIAGRLLASGLLSTTPPLQLLSAILLIVIVGGSSYLTNRQIPVWRNDLSLWSHTVKFSPKDAVAQSNIGVSYLEANQTLLATRHLERAVAIQPNYFEARYNLAITYERQGKLRQALPHYLVLANSGFAQNDIKIRLGAVYQKLGDDQQAREQFEQVLNAEPNNTRATFGLIVIEVKAGHPQKAQQLADTYHAYHPDDHRAEQLLQKLTQAGE